MKLLHINGGHVRNVEFIVRACKLFNIEYYHTDDTFPVDNSYDIIWTPCTWINPDNYPTSKIIFGPQFHVFPNSCDSLYKESKAEHGLRCIYVCLSDWIAKMFDEFVPASLQIIPHVAIPFGLDIESQEKTKPYEYDCIIYYKARHPSILDFCEKFCTEKGLKHKIYSYGSYTRDDYINTLYKTRFVIWVGSHESQGFALEECLATNTPIFLYDVKSMKDEYTNWCYNYNSYSEKLLATSAPYWNDQCGLKVYSNEEFINRFSEFIDLLDTYTPDEYVKSTLTDKICFQRFLDALKIKVS